MVNRRELLGIAAGAGAALAFAPPLDAARGGPELVEGPELLRAHPSSAGRLTQRASTGTLLQRAIPSSGEMLPAVSFGAQERDTSAMTEILKTLVDNGGRVIDAGERRRQTGHHCETAPLLTLV